MFKKMLIVACAWMSVSVFAEDAYPGDAAFVKQAAISELFQIKSGKIALESASSRDVRMFGAMMFVDHAKAYDQLKLMGKNKNWDIPERLGTAQQARLDQFAELRPDDLDREYSAEMAKAHKLDKERFANAAKFAADTDLKAWATGMNRVIGEHLSHVPELTKTTTTVTIEKQ